jgi:hypothetical protein
MDSKLDSKLESWTPNWIVPPACCACFLGSPAPSWCLTCPPWFTHWFLITIKLLDSNLFSRSLADEHQNEFTWWCSYCARDLVIGPCTSIKGVVVSNVVMSSSTGLLGRLQSNLGMKHWKATKKALHYLQGTKHYMLTYKKTDSLEVIGYSDADFVRCTNSQKSTSGYVFTLGNGVISWKNSK